MQYHSFLHCSWQREGADEWYSGGIAWLLVCASTQPLAAVKTVVFAAFGLHSHAKRQQAWGPGQQVWDGERGEVKLASRGGQVSKLII